MPASRAPVLDHQPGALAGQAPAPAVEEHRLGVAPAGPAGGDQRRPAARAQPGGQRGRGVAPEGNDALLRPLAERPHQPRLQVDVAQPQADQLGDAHPGAVQHLEDGPVAPGGRLVAHHGGQQGLHLRLAQRLGQPRRHPGGGDLRPGVGWAPGPRRPGTGAASGPPPPPGPPWPAPGLPRAARRRRPRHPPRSRPPGPRRARPASGTSAGRRAGRRPGWTGRGPRSVASQDSHSSTSRGNISGSAAMSARSARACTDHARTPHSAIL